MSHKGVCLFTFCIFVFDVQIQFQTLSEELFNTGTDIETYHYLVVIFAFQVFNTSGTNNGKTTKRIDIDLVCYVKYVVDIDICNKEEC